MRRLLNRLPPGFSLLASLALCARTFGRSSEAGGDSQLGYLRHLESKHREERLWLRRPKPQSMVYKIDHREPC